MELDKTTLGNFLKEHTATLFKTLNQKHPPQVTTPENLPTLLRKPLGRQALAISAAARSLKSHNAAIIVGEMGTGKTFIAAATAAAVSKRALIMSPPHLVEKWREEILATVPNAAVIIAETISDLERARRIETPVFVVLSRERAKLGPKVISDGFFVQKKPHLVVDRDGNTIPTFKEYAVCNRCGNKVMKDGVILSPNYVASQKRPFCENCSEPLFSYDSKSARRKDGSARYPLAEYVKRKMRGFFDLLILDEVHEYKAADSSQGIAAAMLAESIPRTLSLTGTLFGGYASTLFFLLYRFSKPFRRLYGYDDVKTFIARHGAMLTVKTSYGYDYGIVSRRGRTYVRSKETPSVDPDVLKYLLPITVFVKLSDVAENLPPYTEQVIRVPMGKDLEAWYEEMMDAFGDRISNRLLGAFFHAGVFYLDSPFEEVEIRHPDDGSLIHYSPPLDPSVTYPKEEKLLELVKNERAVGRRVIVFVQNTKSRDLTRRLKNLLVENGYNAEYLHSETVSARKREAWLRKAVDRGVEVLILHPRLVQTGLDLIDFPTIVYYQTEPSVYTLRQAARRSWRIGQQRDVRVFYMVYEDSKQEPALSLLAQKAVTSLALEGHLLEGGLQSAAGYLSTLSLAMALVKARNVDFDPSSIKIATLGIDHAEPENDLAAPASNPFAHLPPALPAPKHGQGTERLPTLEELAAQGHKVKSKAPPNAMVLFPEAFVA